MTSFILEDGFLRQMNEIGNSTSSRIVQALFLTKTLDFLQPKHYFFFQKRISKAQTMFSIGAVHKIHHQSGEGRGLQGFLKPLEFKLICKKLRAIII